MIDAAPDSLKNSDITFIASTDIVKECKKEAKKLGYKVIHEPRLKPNKIVLRKTLQ